MATLSSIHAYNLTVFHTCLLSKKGEDKVIRAIETYTQQQGVERTQAEVVRLIQEIDPQLINTEKKLTGIRKIYHAVIRFFTNASSIRSLVTAFYKLNEEIRIANLISFDLEDPRIPLETLTQIQSLLRHPNLHWLRKDPIIFPGAKPTIRIIDKRTLPQQIREVLENLETIPLPKAPIAPTLIESIPDPDLTIPSILQAPETDESDDDEVPYRPLDPEWATTIARFTTNVLN